MDDDNSLSAEEADAIYDTLVAHAGEREDEDSRNQFKYTQADRHCAEYRFMGALGFGGKFRRRSWDDLWYVDAYPEDLTPERRQIISNTNRALVDVRARFRSQ